MGKRAGILIGVVALVLLAWVITREPARRGGVRTEPATEPAATPQAPSLHPADSLPLTNVARAREAAGVLAESSEAVVAPAEPLLPARRLRVRVRAESGDALQHMDVRIELASELHQRSTSHTAQTDAHGLATFDGLERDDVLGDEDLEVRVSLEALFLPVVETRFLGEPWPSEPVELVVPGSGAVVVTVVDEKGELLSGRGRDVELTVERELQPGAQVWRESARLTRTLDEGQATFPVVGLGLELQASYDDRPDHPPGQVEFAGPARPGEQVRVELRLPEPEAVLTLRLLAPDRTPLASVPVEVGFRRVIGDGSFSSSDQRSTDGEGRLAVSLREGWSEGERRELTLSHRPTGRPESHASVDLSRELGPHERDLGDILLVERALLVGGRVVAPPGANLSEVSVAVERSWGEGGEDSWDSMAWTSVAADGSFAFYDDPPGVPLRLAPESNAFQPIEPIPFVPGTSNLEIHLREGVTLRGNVLLPAGLPPQAIGITASGAEERSRRSTAASGAGVFELSGLAPGSYDVEFSLRPTAESLLVIPGVVARAGDGQDPRLVDVDLTALARRVRLGVLASDGTGAQGGWVHVLQSPGGQEIAFVIEAGVAELLVPAAGSDVEVSVPGHRLLRIDDLATDREVRLEPAFRVQCELAPEVELPASGSLQLRLLPTSPAGNASSNYTLYRGHEQVGWFSTAFGNDENSFSSERRTLEFVVPSLGTYEVVFHLVRGSESGGRISFSLAAAGANARLTLDESSAGATFTVEPEPTEYAQKLAGK